MLIAYVQLVHCKSGAYCNLSPTAEQILNISALELENCSGFDVLAVKIVYFDG